MFQQYTGDGVNVFIAIVAAIIGFAVAMGVIDFRKVNKEQKKE